MSNKTMIEGFFEGEENGKRIEEIDMTNLIQISVKTVTPLLQMDEVGGQRKRYVYEGNQTGAVPFYSANGLRGILRRVAFKQQLEVAKQIDKNFKVSPEIFYLYTSGGGFDKTSAVLDEYINYETEDKVRESAPILSIFGAGLSQLEGKLAITDLLPAADVEKFNKIGNGDDGRLISKILGKNTFFRSDTVKASGFLYDSIVDMEDVNRWVKDYYKKVILAKATKKIKDAKGQKDKIQKILDELNTGVNEIVITIEDIEKLQKEGKLSNGAREEHSHIQQPVEVEFIIPNVRMSASANSKYGTDFTEVEFGCLISSLLEVSKMQIGAAKRIGFGILDWKVEIDGQLMFESVSDENYLLKKDIQVSDKGQEMISAWEKWLKERANKVNLEDLVK